MSVEFINWYWIYSANIWGMYVIWRYTCIGYKLPTSSPRTSAPVDKFPPDNFPPDKFPYGQLPPGQVPLADIFPNPAPEGRTETLQLTYIPQMLAVYIQYKYTYKKMYIPDQTYSPTLRPKGAQKPSN